mmetsp:Transcript_54704/g.152622  ORF Transcript_54704/g.152622 Transcript_54704/m.152622 type:complete len:723 (-) Transcript_54704:242-2410(-)
MAVGNGEHMATRHSFLALTPPAPVGSWRCKEMSTGMSTRRLVDIEAAADAITGNLGGSRALTPATLSATPLPPGTPLDGTISKGVRLERLTPEVLRRLDRSQIYDEERLGSSMSTTHRSNFGPQAPLRRRGGPPRIFGELLDPLVRESQFEGLNFPSRNRSLAPAGLGGSGPLPGVGQETQELRCQLIEAQKRIATLVQTVQLRDNVATALRIAIIARSVGIDECRICHVALFAWRGVTAEQRRLEAQRQVSEANERFRTVVAEAAARDQAAADRLEEVRVQAAVRVATVKEEAEKRATAVANSARAVREQATHCALRAAKVQDCHVLFCVFRAWRADTVKAKLQGKLEVTATALAASHDEVAAAKRQRRNAEETANAWKAAAAAAGDRQRRAEARATKLEAAGCFANVHSQESGAIQGRQQHALYDGGVCSTTMARVSMVGIIIAWRMAVGARRQVAAMQAKLFAEEAARSAALDAQRRDSDRRFLEKEAQHREAQQRLRAEIAGGEARHADALMEQEAESAQRLAALDSDFAAALREAIALPAQADPAPSAETAGDSNGALQASVGARAAASATDAEARLTSVVRALRARADARILELEARHSDLLQTERGRSARLLAEADRRHNDAMRRMQEAMARRDSNSVFEMGELESQGIADADDHRLFDLEALLVELGYEDIADLTQLFDDDPSPSHRPTTQGSSGSQATDNGSEDFLADLSDEG